MDINQIMQIELSFPRVGVQETSREAYYENREAKGPDGDNDRRGCVGW